MIDIMYRVSDEQPKYPFDTWYLITLYVLKNRIVTFFALIA